MIIEQATSSPYEVRVMRQDSETVVLRDEAGQTLEIHPSILRDNGLVVAEGRVTLPQSVYEHYYGSINLLRRYEDVIASSPQAAEFSSTAWRGGGIPMGRAERLSLGVLLALWHDPRFRRACPKCGEPGYVYRIAGSLLSGRNHVTAACPACARSITDESRSRACSLGRMMRAIEEVGRLRGGVWIRR